jgi:hypothetical protein
MIWCAAARRIANHKCSDRFMVCCMNPCSTLIATPPKIAVHPTITAAAAGSRQCLPLFEFWVVSSAFCPSAHSTELHP